MHTNDTDPNEAARTSPSMTPTRSTDDVNLGTERMDTRMRTVNANTMHIGGSSPHRALTTRIAARSSRSRPMREPVFNETMQLGIVVRDLEAMVRRFVDGVSNPITKNMTCLPGTLTR
jgi:hypothetical protein